MLEAWPEQAARVDRTGLAKFVQRIADKHTLSEMTFLCIGTDRSSGDCLGPWIGTKLIEAGFEQVIGSLEHPCDAEKLPDMIPRLPSNGTILAIDACLGRPESVGTYLISAAPLIPARSMGRSFPPLGAYSIAGIVNATGPKPYWTLQTTSLYRVMNMACEAAETIIQGWRRQSETSERK